MHTTYLLVCCTDYKTRGLAHEIPPFIHLKNIACIRFMPLVNRLLWATVCTWHTYYNTQIQTHSNALEYTRTQDTLWRDDLFFARSKFLLSVIQPLITYIKCIMALYNLLWLMITLNFFYCTLPPWPLLPRSRARHKSISLVLSFDPRTWSANCSTTRKRYISPLCTIIN